MIRHTPIVNQYRADPWNYRTPSLIRLKKPQARDPIKDKRVMGIEPTWPAWKAGTLPLSYTRNPKACYTQSMLWREQDSNLRRHCHQIYSLAPLAARVSRRQNLLQPFFTGYVDTAPPESQRQKPACFIPARRTQTEHRSYTLRNTSPTRIKKPFDQPHD